jgi:hypothetical protein
VPKNANYHNISNNNNTINNYLINVAISGSHSLHGTITEKLQNHAGLKEELIKKMANENSSYNTISIIHKGYDLKQIARMFKHCFISDVLSVLNARSNSTYYGRYS